jgi:GT2 family glycosyltransferase
MTMQAPRARTAFIVLPVHNRRETTRAFCERLSRQSCCSFVLVLVDDGSTDGTAEMVASFPFRKEICTGDGSLWWAGGLRRGMHRVAALGPSPDDIIVWINDDTQIGSDFLEKSLREMERCGQGTLLAVPTLFQETGRRDEGCFVCFWPRFTFHDYGRHPENIDCASSRCLLIRYGDFISCGTLRPGLLPHYFSDFEYTIRARRRGFRIIPALTVTCGSTEGTTGFHSMERGSSGEILGRMFSPKYAANPVHMFLFILLAAPLQWKVNCLAYAFKSFFSVFLLAAIFRRLSPERK